MQNIDFFRSKTKVRGNSFQEKFADLRTKWKKVYQDCQGDQSSYRIEYASVHQEMINYFQQIEDRGLDLEMACRQFLPKIETEISNSFKGRKDAFSYIFAEIEAALS